MKTSEEKHDSREGDERPGAESKADTGKKTYGIQFKMLKNLDMNGIQAMHRNGLLTPEIPRVAPRVVHRSISISEAKVEA